MRRKSARCWIDIARHGGVDRTLWAEVGPYRARVRTSGGAGRQPEDNVGDDAGHRRDGERRDEEGGSSLFCDSRM